MKTTIKVITTNVFNKIEYECPIREARFIQSEDSAPIDYHVFEAAPDLLKALESAIEDTQNGEFLTYGKLRQAKEAIAKAKLVKS